jgi:DNA-directed RNA polymerase subunit RPC12/RpoP
MKGYHLTYRYDPFNEKPIYDFDYLLEMNPPEPPRKPYDFPTNGHCPKCESADFVNTGNYFHCTRCGTELWNEEKIGVEGCRECVPKKYQAYAPRKTRIVLCARCGEETETKSNSAKVYCADCRAIVTKANQKEYHKTYRKKRAA